MKKFLIPLLLAIGLLPQLTEAQTHYTLTVGAGAATSQYVPANAYYNYSFTQFIYHANEVGLDGVIDTLKFNVSSNSTTRTWTVYMAETSHSTFSSGSDAVPESNFQQVFSGSVNCSPGWVTIPLDSTFTYQDSADLIICVIDQTGSYVSSYPYFYGQNMTDGNRSIYQYNDGSPYSLASPPSCSTSSFQPLMQLGITSNSLYCALPSEVAVAGITGDQATIAWHENGTATDWEVVVSDTAVTDFSTVSPNYPTDTTYTVTGLDPNTLYYVYVRAACSSTDFSGWTNAVTFVSACVGTQEIPYSTGFENLATGETPNCWQQVAVGSSSASTFPAAYAYAGNARNSNVYFEFESSSGQTEIAALPPMDNINQLALSFYASVMNINFVLEVGVMEDTTFVPVDTVQLTAGSGNNWAGSYYPYTVYFNNYLGTGDRIAMRVTAAGSYTLMMDDLSVDYAPTCPAPTYLTATASSVDWIALSWTENGSATSWTIEYDTVPIADSLLGMNLANTVSATSTTETLTNLDTATTYYIYVYADCGSEACSTVASTLSALPAEMPFVCTFEQSGNNGWEMLNGEQTNQWHVGSATSNGGNQSLYISNDNGSSNAYNTSSTSYTYAIRTLNIADSGVYAYSYDWKCQGESHSYDFCRAFLVPTSYQWTAGVNPAGSTYNFSSWGIPAGWVELTENFSSPRTMSQSISWRTAVGEIAINTPGTYNLVFAWANDASGGSQPPMAVDNVNFLQLTCPAPRNLTATYVTGDSVIIEWQPGGSETSWLVTDGGSISDVVYDTTYLFENLLPSTNYSFTVYALCDEGDTSMPAALSVRTPCGEWAPLPFNDDFDSYASSSYPECWTRIINSSSYPYITTSYGHCIQSGGGASIISPRMPMPLNRLFVSFDLRKEGSSSGTMEFGYTYNPNSVDSMVVISTINPVNTGQYYHYEFDLSNDTCVDSVYLVWHQDGTTYWYYWLDNVSVSVASSCPAVDLLRCSSHTNNMATIEWSDTSADHSEVILYIATTNNMAMAFDSVSVSVGTTSHVFTGLRGNTRYYVFAKAICSDEDSRVVVCDFTTDVDCAPVENLRVVATDYHAFGLNWDAPTAGESATAYVVSYRAAGASAWISDTVSTPYYYVSGLDTNTEYQYRVSSICDTLASSSISGNVFTQGCGRMITAGGTTYSYLPTYILYNYSYTQQIYLDAEIGDGLDSISGISFYATSNISTRNIQIYLGNTDQSSFSSTSNYIPVDSLQLVYTGTLSGSGWINLNFDTVFVRQAGRNLVVATDDNTGSYVSSVPFGATSAANRSIYFYQDGSDINPASPSASSYALVSYVNQIKLTSPNCFIPSCNTPIVMVAGAYANEIDVVWNVDSGATYTVEYMREGTDVWVVADSANTTGTCNITGLLPAYNYAIRVSFDCNGVTLTGSVQTATICAPVALPYTEDFESLSGTFSRNCWFTGTTNLGTSYPNPTVVNLTGDPNKLLLLYNGAYVILPEMDAPLNQLQIRFNFVQGGDNVRLIMGIMDDPLAPIATIRPIDTLIRSNYDTTSAYVYVTYPLDGISDTTGHLTFWDAFNDNYSFLDNIVVEYIPNCTSVQEVVATATDANSATVSWTTSGTAATSFLVEYGPRGFAAGTGTVQAAASSPATLTGLSHSTSYDVYVYAVCASSSDTSIASQVARFATECAPITTLPYVQNFENIVDPGSTATNIVPNCWASKVLPAGTGYEQPHVFYTTDITHAPSQQYCFYFDGIGIAALPEMGIPLDSLRISFHEFNSAPSTYGLIIGAVSSADTNFEASFEPIDTIPFQGSGNEFNVVSYLNGYTGSNTRIAIASYNTAGAAYADQYIDNLVIDRVPNCIAPQRVVTTLLTNVAADLAWSTSTAPNYSIEYGVHGFTPGTGTTLTSTTNSVNLVGLTPLTQYDVYLVSQCSATETSDTTFFTFTTLRAAPVTTFPYICTFADSAMATAWEPVNGTQTNKWYLGNSTYYGSGDNQSLYISNDGGANNSYTNSSTSFVYAYRTFSLNAGSYSIYYNWKAYGESSWDYLRAWLAPADFEFTPGLLPDGSTSSSSYTSSSPAGWISLDGGTKQNLQSSWQTSSADVTITTPGDYNLVFMWANDGSSGTNPPAAIDNVEVYHNTCPAPIDIHASVANITSLEVDWTDLVPAIGYVVEYGPHGFTLGTGTVLYPTSHPVIVTGLDTLTEYDFYVKPICSATDTGRYSMERLSTAFCDNASVVSIGSTTSTSTTYNYPVNNFYRYTLTETIIDSAELNGPQEISAISYYYDYASPTTDKTNCTIYLQPTNKSVFTSSSDMVALDSATAVPVYTGPLNCSQGWNMFVFDTTYSYDGTGNLLIIVDDNSNDYNSSSYVFKTASCTGYKTITYYSDTYNPDVTSPSGFSGSTSYYASRVVMRLTACNGASCPQPVITSATHDYHSATITWTGTGTDYEVNIKEASAIDWPATDIAVTGNTYTFTGLQPETAYIYRVRQHCVEDSSYSNWATDVFTTDDLPCLPPTGLTVSDLTNAEGTFAWSPIGNETLWDIHVWNTGGLDSVYRVTTNPAIVSGFTAGVTYNAAIRAICGVDEFEGDYGDTIHFTTATCPDVTGLTSSNVTESSVTLNWTADPMAESWQIEYGFAGFAQGTGTRVTTNVNSYVVTGLEDESSYDFYVRAICGTDWNSEGWAHVSATTPAASDPTYTVTVTVNDAAMGSATGGGTYRAGQSCTVTATPNSDYHFVSWSNGVTDNPYTFTVVANITLTATFAADSTEGIEEVAGNALCTIYPNPTSDVTTISVSGANGKVRITVVDINGRTVATETLECSSDCEKTMDVANLAQGTYFVKITGENVNMVKKLVVR